MDSDCEHDGTCLSDTLKCMCTSGYSGDICEIGKISSKLLHFNQDFAFPFDHKCKVTQCYLI